MGQPATDVRYRYATRLNSFRSGRSASLLDLIEAIRQVDGLTAIEVNYPQHLQTTGEGEFAAAVEKAGLAVTAISLRYDDPAYAQGVFTSPDPAVRRMGIRLTCDAVDAAIRLGVPHVNVWMAHDGFDYPFAVDYDRVWRDEIDGFREVAAYRPDIRISVEYKPLEPRRVATIASMADALLAIRDVDLPNFGVQIDFCHALMAREQPAAEAARALAAGRLFGVHLNDGYGPADDGLIVGSVHPWHTLELLWYLRRYDYRGTIYFDTFPDRLDPVAECAANLRAVNRFEHMLDRLDNDALHALQQQHDTIGINRVIESALWGEDHD